MPTDTQHQGSAQSSPNDRAADSHGLDADRDSSSDETRSEDIDGDDCITWGEEVLIVP
jgi:hypothetical protein